MSILIVYLVCVIVGQAITVGIGLLIDPYSSTVALSVFIPTYYAMYWVAWRVTLMIADKSPQPEADSNRDQGGSATKIASWLLAPAVLALDLCD